MVEKKKKWVRSRNPEALARTELHVFDWYWPKHVIKAVATLYLNDTYPCIASNVFYKYFIYFYIHSHHTPTQLRREKKHKEENKKKKKKKKSQLG